MTVFTHFLYFVTPEAMLAATPQGALPWREGDPFTTLAPLSAEVSFTDAPDAYGLVLLQPTAAGDAWQIGRFLPLTLGWDASRRLLTVNATRLPLPALEAGIYHLGIWHSSSGTLVAASNAVEPGADADHTHILRYRNFSPSFLGEYADPEFACELRLRLRIDRPQYLTGWVADPNAPFVSRMQKFLSLHTDYWPQPWLEALGFALRHDELLLRSPFGGYEPLQLVGDISVDWPDSPLLRLGMARARLRSFAFAALPQLYGLPDGAFAGGFAQGFSL